MFSSLSRTLLRRPLFLLTTTLRLISTTTSTSNRPSFAVSYLVNSCGLSPESALFVSERVNFETSARPDAVIDVFKNHGFSQSQISGIFRKWPRLILASPERTLLPKLKYLRSVGFSGPDLAQMITAAPYVLTRSLEKHLIPNFSRLRDFLRGDKYAVTAIRRSPRILLQGFETTVDPFVKILRDKGVRESSIVWLVKCQSRTMITSCDHLEEIVEKTKEMGFDDPSAAKFAVAMLAVVGMSESTWERKFNAYGRWGWSRDDAMRAFVKIPWCMTLSEEKIMAVMGFFVKEMEFESSFLLRHPRLMSLSLRKRIRPRCMVFKHLSSHGLMKTKIGLTTLLTISEEDFLEKFLTPHIEEAPELLDIYREKKHMAMGTLVP
ncbi:transcription termination factor MTEF1, chloroplastic-like [Syzygium oleosum]|uniref:transcription termination factor MTEF1, chloroplastic-like n=1 Tax=Syzygium oleosum TaxID=219896 RepID=UPI0024BBEA7D|nr:transcription termination factor MTEF1, chloroplastic-like [Syzygium oleosum]XP_056168141.1 transcription termination factor MTEF1, chloroplastic-like [Syzygium oleosum]